MECLATLVYRSAVYTWDGAKAGEKVAHGKKKTVEVTAGDPDVPPVEDEVQEGQGQAGRAVRRLRDDLARPTRRPTRVSSVIWPVTSGEEDVLPGGDFVFINDSGNEALWTTQPWGQIPFDNAFKAKLK